MNHSSSIDQSNNQRYIIIVIVYNQRYVILSSDKWNVIIVMVVMVTPRAPVRRLRRRELRATRDSRETVDAAQFIDGSWRFLHDNQRVIFTCSVGFTRR